MDLVVDVQDTYFSARPYTDGPDRSCDRAAVRFWAIFTLVYILQANSLPDEVQMASQCLKETVSGQVADLGLPRENLQKANF